MRLKGIRHGAVRLSARRARRPGAVQALRPAGPGPVTNANHDRDAVTVSPPRHGRGARANHPGVTILTRSRCLCTLITAVTPCLCHGHPPSPAVQREIASRPRRFRVRRPAGRETAGRVPPYPAARQDSESANRRSRDSGCSPTQRVCIGRRARAGPGGARSKAPLPPPRKPLSARPLRLDPPPETRTESSDSSRHPSLGRGVRLPLIGRSARRPAAIRPARLDRICVRRLPIRVPSAWTRLVGRFVWR